MIRIDRIAPIQNSNRLRGSESDWHCIALAFLIRVGPGTARTARLSATKNDLRIRAAARVFGSREAEAERR